MGQGSSLQLTESPPLASPSSHAARLASSSPLSSAATSLAPARPLQRLPRLDASLNAFLDGGEGVYAQLPIHHPNQREDDDEDEDSTPNEQEASAERGQRCILAAPSLSVEEVHVGQVIDARHHNGLWENCTVIRTSKPDAKVPMQLYVRFNTSRDERWIEPSSNHRCARIAHRDTMSCGTPIPYPLAGKLCGRLIDVRIPLCATPCQRGVDQDAPSGVDGQNSVTSMKDACRRAGGDVERMVWTEALILQYSQRQFRVSISSFNGSELWVHCDDATECAAAFSRTITSHTVRFVRICLEGAVFIAQSYYEQYSEFIDLEECHPEPRFAIVSEGEFCHPEQHNALNAAVLSGNRELVKWLVENAGSDINSPNALYSPLMLAAIQDYQSIAEYLVKRQADIYRVCGALEYFNATVELIAEMNSPAIYHLVCRAHYARFRTMLVRGTMDLCDLEAPLHFTRQRAFLRRMKRTLSVEGVYDSASPVLAAIRSRIYFEDTFQRFSRVAQGVDAVSSVRGWIEKMDSKRIWPEIVNQRLEGNGETLLMNMLCGGCTELAKVLLDRGADPTLKDNRCVPTLLFASLGGIEALRLVEQRLADAPHYCYSVQSVQGGCGLMYSMELSQSSSNTMPQRSGTTSSNDDSTGASNHVSTNTDGSASTGRRRRSVSFYLPTSSVASTEDGVRLSTASQQQQEEDQQQREHHQPWQLGRVADDILSSTANDGPQAESSTVTSDSRNSDASLRSSVHPFSYGVCGMPGLSRPPFPSLLPNNTQQHLLSPVLVYLLQKNVAWCRMARPDGSQLLWKLAPEKRWREMELLMDIAHFDGRPGDASRLLPSVSSQPLHWCIKRRAPLSLTTKLCASCNVNFRHKATEFTSLMHAADATDRVEEAARVVASGGNPFLRLPDGSTALHISLEEQEPAMVCLLIRAAVFFAVHHCHEGEESKPTEHLMSFGDLTPKCADDNSFATSRSEDNPSSCLPMRMRAGSQRFHPYTQPTAACQNESLSPRSSRQRKRNHCGCCTSLKIDLPCSSDNCTHGNPWPDCCNRCANALVGGSTRFYSHADEETDLVEMDLSADKRLNTTGVCGGYGVSLAMVLALRGEAEKCLDEVLRENVDVNRACDYLYLAPLHFAVCSNDYTTCYRLIVDGGADPLQCCLLRYNSFLLACLMGHCNALRAILDAAEKLSSMSLSALPHTPIAQPTFSSRSSPCLPSINENARDAALLSPVSTKAPSSPEKEKTLRPSLFLWRRRLLLSSRASSATSCSSPLEMAIVSRDLASVELLMSLSDEECILVAPTQSAACLSTCWENLEPKLAHQMAEKIRPRLPDVVAGWGFDELESVVSREGRESPDNYCRARKRRRAD